MREFFFDTDWPTWAFAIAGVLALAVVLRLYRHERREIGWLRGGLLTLLRLVLVVLVLLMFAQPVLRTWQERQTQRKIAVLVDDSASMMIPDAQASPAERLRWADGAGLLPHDLRRIRPELLAAQLQIIARHADRLLWQTNEVRLYRKQQTPVPQPLADEADGTNRVVGELAEQFTRDSAALIDGSADDLRTLLKAAAQAQWARLANVVRDEVLPAAKELARLTAKRQLAKLDEAALGDIARQADALASRCRSAAAMLDASLAPAGQQDAETETLAWQIDLTEAARLPAEGQQALSRIARMTREQLARRLLAGQGGDLFSARGRVQADEGSEWFDISTYRFGRSCSPLPADRIEQSTEPATGLVAASQPDSVAGEDATDLELAFQHVLAQSGGRDSLAGVVVITDGRFNRAGAAELAASRAVLGPGSACPVVPVTIGSRTPPTDLAVVNLQSPESLMKGDTATVTALVKLDGLSGLPMDVELLRADSETPIDTQRIRAASNFERRQVEFSLKPESIEATSYRVRVRPAGAVAQPAAFDCLPDNNVMPFNIRIDEDPTKVLLIDGPPRWEFEYVRNLLLRDKGVRVQHLLFEPAFIQPQMPPATPGQPPQPARYVRPVRHASVKDAMEKNVAEVTALPKTTGELFAFDVVIIGDIAPTDLPEQTQRDLERFVSERGGTLIVIAGKENLPGRYSDQPLAGLLPVTLAPSDSLIARASITPYRVRLTDDGSRSELLRLAVEPGDNQKVWDRLPMAKWRCAAATAKPGATVLAFAEPVEGPAADRAADSDADRPAAGPQSGESDDPDSERARRNEIARQRPLILTQTYGVGRVVFLAFDRTWMLRYKVGDKYHHKLWGQVMRWATAGRLTGPSPFIKLGAGRPSYRTGEEIVIKAKVSREDFAPVTDAELVARIRIDGKNDRLVNLLPAWLAAASQPETAPASSQPDGRGLSEGVFIGVTGPLPKGVYDVVLEARRVVGLPDSERTRDMKTKLFIVGDDPVEIRELAARPPTELATGGVVLSPSTVRLAWQMFGEPVIRDRRHTDLALWSSWQLLLAFAIVASIEWILRKRFGLI